MSTWSASVLAFIDGLAAHRSEGWCSSNRPVGVGHASGFAEVPTHHATDRVAVREFVSIVITCFNQAHFLHEAIESCLAQTYPHFEILVVDDGSDDNTAACVERYPGIRYVRQDNRGLAAARNTGLAGSRGEFLVFLDADDRLLPTALEDGLRQFAAHPECAFVAGRHRMIGFDGRVLWDHTVGPDDDDLYRALLRRNFIAMHAAVMYQRLVFGAVGGFDPRPRSAEDYDLYLRVARRFPVWWHPAIVAEYRRHGDNMTRNSGLVLKSALLSLRTQRRQGLDRRAVKAYRAGTTFFRRYYGAELVKHVADAAAIHDWTATVSGLLTLLRYSPRQLWGLLSTRSSEGASRTTVPAHRASSLQDAHQINDIRQASIHEATADVGRVGERSSIEEFLRRHAADLHGRVLEIGGPTSVHEMGARVRAIDRLSANGNDPHTTIVADLSGLDHVPSDSFDCIVATLSSEQIAALEFALRGLHRMLKPGGVLLLSAPGFVDGWTGRSVHGRSDLSPPTALRRLFASRWPDGSFEVTDYAADQRRPGPSVDDTVSQGPLLVMVRAMRRQAADGATPTAGKQLIGRSIVLLYHRIGHPPLDPWGLSVSVNRFAEHLDVILRQAHAVRLSDIADGRRAANRSVAVTFDDGYADTLSEALPLLERFDVPATVFLATGAWGTPEFWWDALARLVFGPTVLPPTLTLTMDGRTYDWKLGAGAVLGGVDWGDWRAYHDDPTPRHYLYRSLWELLRAQPIDRRRRALDTLQGWSGAADPTASEGRPLTADEVATLHRSALIELGCHTRTHPVLAALDPVGQRAEIVGSRRDLESITGREARFFAYPYGQRWAYTGASVALVHEAGFHAACANRAGVIAAGTDPLQLPRVHVENWDGETFSRCLSRWLDADA
jgi:glycosyltransferase involved in cell wall biosynthesis/peptidoglycan/xylan/chitin deacetylase (PgdA/CDA1 family)